MKSTGIVRKLDHLGRVTLPIELRRSFDIDTGDGLEIFTEEGKIILQPEKRCIKCHTKDELVEVEDICLCKKCGKETVNKLINKLEVK
jgi:transcriptional pleiotropic regulator of transition state genes